MTLGDLFFTLLGFVIGISVIAFILGCKNDA